MLIDKTRFVWKYDSVYYVWLDSTERLINGSNYTTTIDEAIYQMAKFNCSGKINTYCDYFLDKARLKNKNVLR